MLPVGRGCAQRLDVGRALLGHRQCDLAEEIACHTHTQVLAASVSRHTTTGKHRRQRQRQNESETNEKAESKNSARSSQ